MKSLKGLFLLIILLLCGSCDKEEIKKSAIEPSEDFTTDFTQIPGLRNNFIHGTYEYTEELPHVRVHGACKVEVPCLLSDFECIQIVPECYELEDQYKGITAMEWIDYSEILWDEEEPIWYSKMLFDCRKDLFLHSKKIDAKWINQCIEAVHVIAFYPDFFEVDYYGDPYAYYQDEDYYGDVIAISYGTYNRVVYMSVAFYEENSPYGYMYISTSTFHENENLIKEYGKETRIKAYVEASELKEIGNIIENDTEIPLDPFCFESEE